ncbi:HAMP domain-containing histidine kinase [Patescibacteria group bacterium]|nr:HAMP domain-containing histidine kinase [Patescibacteria group bacterium]
MKFLPETIGKSLRFKFSLLVLVLLFLVYTVSTGILIYQNVNTQRNTLVSQVRAFAKLSAKPIGANYSLYFNSGYLKFKELTQEILSLNNDVERVQIISVKGEVLFDSDDLEFGKSNVVWAVEDQTILANVNSNVESEVPPRNKNSSPDQIVEPYFEDFGAHPFSIRYFISYDSVSQNLFSTILTTLFLSFIFFAGSIILIISVVNRIIIAPIETVIQGTRKISKGDFSYKIEVNTKDEVEDLASAVNQMAQTLRKNIEDLKELDKLKDEFISLASHNLRTPLTVIKGYVSSLQEDSSLNTDARKQLVRISKSTKELETITETLLSLVSLEKGEKPIIKKQVDVVTLLEEIIGNMNEKILEKRINFVFELPQKSLPKIELEEERITQAFVEIMDNAIKFNKANGKVIIKLHRESKNAVISIKDEGIGIPEEEKNKVFKKFHRTTDVLTYDYVGIGLGLYLAKLIIEAHGGKIWFDSKAGEGSTFYVSLPLASS